MNMIVDTVIEQVTVYPDRARVTRHGSIDLQKGAHQLIVEELPLSLEPDSLRAGGEGTARVRLLGVDLSVQHYDQTPAARVVELEDAIQNIRDEMRQLADRKAGWEAHQGYLGGLRQATTEFAWGLSRGRTKVDDQIQLVQFLQEQDTAVRDAVRDIDHQNREKKKRLDTLMQQLKQLQSARPKRRRRAVVDVQVAQEGTFQLALNYVVKNAGWQPLYDVRFLEDGPSPTRQLTLSVQAEISQESGEDWTDVRLSVSTARPALNQRLPELKPWHINQFIPPRPLARAKAAPRAKATRATEESEMDMMMAEPEIPFAAPAPAEIAPARMQSEGTAVTFRLAGSGDIPSDGSPHKALVNEYQLDPHIDYLTVPKHTDAVYRRVKVPNSSGGPLLSGPANLFVGAEFIGQTSLDFTAAGAEIELLLGVESRIFVSRELSRRDVDKKLLREQRQLRYGYKIELKNHLTETAVVELHDHIPLAGHEKIKVKLGQIQPAPQERSDMNLIEWSLTMEPGREMEVYYEFTVEHPREMRLAGLTE